MIPLMKLAIKASKKPIRILASPWSPPDWMKTPVKGKKRMTGSAFPNGLRPEHKYRDAWARYISLFVSAYQGQGVDIWAVTPQNEPEFPAPWEACAYNSSDSKNFIRNYLGPTLKKEHPEVNDGDA